MIVEPRPLQHARALERMLGRDLWRRYDRLLADVRADGVSWPSHVHAPIAAAYAIVSGGGDNRVSGDRVALVGQLAAIAAWRTTKGVYRWDPDLLEQIWSTPLDAAIPTEVLHRLPEWCVYLDLEGRVIDGTVLHGAYVHLEQDATTRREELRLLLDSDSGLLPVPIHLGGTIASGAAATALTVRAEAIAIGASDLEMRAREPALRDAIVRLAPLVSLVLYLCSEEPDIRADDDQGRRPARPVGRAVGAQRVTTWDTGYRIGAALRWAQAHRSEAGDGVHASPIGHVRRAHWHTYWIGSEVRGDRRRVLRWLAPILVGVDLPDELAAVVRQVTPR